MSSKSGEDAKSLADETDCRARRGYYTNGLPPLSQSRSVPNPGSREAIIKGCLCPVLDNGHGRGYMGGAALGGGGGPVFVIVVGCPLHRALSREGGSGQ